MSGCVGPDVSESGLVLAFDAADRYSFTLNEVEVLVVAGGGGGGGSTAGGGGGGGVIYNRNFAVTPGSALTVTVGSGGQGTVRADQGVATNTNGGNSIFGSLTAIGGGKGYSGSASNTPGSSAVGGSGGGGGYYSGGLDPKGSGTSSAGTVGQGFAGGDGAAIAEWGGGGGGGAGGPGGAQVANNTLRTGGPGLGFDISGSFQYYGGGGGGGCHSSGFSLGGIGGGGNGGDGQTYVATAGTPNTGGGGGGGGYYQFGPGGAAGGSGIVIVRYPGPQRAIGGTVTTVDRHTIHTFTTVGSATFTPLSASNGSAILGLSDLSGRGNFGTTANSPTYSSANGGSIVFNGSNNRIVIPTLLLGNGNLPWTCTAWVKTTSIASTLGEGSVLSNSSGGPVYSMMGVNSGKIVYWTYQNSAWAQKLGVGKTINDNIWHFLSWVNYSNYTMDMYIDGSLDSNVANSTSGNNNPIDIIGASWASAFSANIAQVQIYNRALTAAEISQNFNALRGRFGV